MSPWIIAGLCYASYAIGWIISTYAANRELRRRRSAWVGKLDTQADTLVEVITRPIR